MGLLPSSQWCEGPAEQVLSLAQEQVLSLAQDLSKLKKEVQPLVGGTEGRATLFHATKVNQQILSHCVTRDGVWPNSNIPSLNMAAASLPPFISGKTFSCDQPENRVVRRRELWETVLA